MSHYADAYERFAHDIINAVMGGSLSGSAPLWQIKQIAEILRHGGPGVTYSPRPRAQIEQQLNQPKLAAPPKPVKLPPILPGQGYQPLPVVGPVLAPPKFP